MKQLKEFHKILLENYTGKINILDKFSQQFLGEILQNNGAITRFSYKTYLNKKAIEQFSIDLFMDKLPLQFVTEPESINITEKSINISIDLLIKTVIKIAKDESIWAPLSPPINSTLSVTKKLSGDLEELSDEDLEILCNIIELKSVSSVYKQSPMTKSEITKTLISLKKRKIISINRQYA